MSMYAPHEADPASNPPAGGYGEPHGFSQHEDRRHRNGASYIESLLAGTADIGNASFAGDPGLGGSTVSTPSSVPLS